MKLIKAVYRGFLVEMPDGERKTLSEAEYKAAVGGEIEPETVTLTKAEHDELVAKADGKELIVKIDASELEAKIEAAKSEFEESLTGKVVIDEDEFKSLSEKVTTLESEKAELEAKIEKLQSLVKKPETEPDDEKKGK